MKKLLYCHLGVSNIKFFSVSNFHSCLIYVKYLTKFLQISTICKIRPLSARVNDWRTRFPIPKYFSTLQQTGLFGASSQRIFFCIPLSPPLLPQLPSHAKARKNFLIIFEIHFKSKIFPYITRRFSYFHEHITCLYEKRLRYLEKKRS